MRGDCRFAPYQLAEAYRIQVRSKLSRSILRRRGRTSLGRRGRGRRVRTSHAQHTIVWLCGRLAREKPSRDSGTPVLQRIVDCRSYYPGLATCAIGLPAAAAERVSIRIKSPPMGANLSDQSTCSFRVSLWLAGWLTQAYIPRRSIIWTATPVHGDHGAHRHQPITGVPCVVLRLFHECRDRDRLDVRTAGRTDSIAGRIKHHGNKELSCHADGSSSVRPPI